MNTKLCVCTEFLTCLCFLTTHLLLEALFALTARGVRRFQYDDTDKDFLPKWSMFLFSEGSDWFSTSYEDSRPFEENYILISLLLINGYQFFFLLRLTRKPWVKAIRELCSYGATSYLLMRHCANPHGNHTCTVAVAGRLCGAEKGWTVNKHTYWMKLNDIE